MFRFFRSLRQSLIGKNQSGKYLKYALGEIVLVVIGILIALQINTWNEGLVNKKKEKEYLNNLIEDLKTQENLVNTQIRHEATMRGNCEKALKYLNAEKIPGDSVSKYLETVTRRTFVVNDPTFQDLKSSGNILLIKDSDLRKKILSFYQYLDYSALVIQTSNETSVAEFRHFLINHSVVNVNYLDSLTVAGGVNFTINTVEVPWAKSIQEEKFRDKNHLFKVLNRVAARGRTSSVHLDLMNRLQKRIEQMRQEMVDYINQS
ncbi:DUF6090 family protein [Robiginitalea sp.]|uniref:DUF6090 family protein n=1 Tax=Robiginitalea sp. TaxID=1902411 RepID=UPI003C70EDE9